jgi:superfamily II DNA or RNA helicase
MRELIETGYLVDADVWAPADPDLKGVKVVAGDYQEGQLGEAMDKAQLVGDIVAHWLKLSHGKQTMVFAVNIAHSKHICDQFKANGIAAVHVDYHMTDEEKRAIYADFKAGRSMVLCNCALLSEGADFPACETLILARPTKSKVRYVQMFGRVLRTSAETGKTRALVLDHSGTVQRLGFPWDFSVTHLDDGKPKKSEGGEQDKPEPLPTPCPHCSYMKPPKTPVCPSCGFESKRPNEVETADGELVQVRGKKPKAQTRLQDMGRPSIYGQLCQMAQDRKKTQKWIQANYKNIFGSFPHQEYHLEPPTPELLSWIHSRNIAWAKSQRAA